jgi:hypothetical protein
MKKGGGRVKNVLTYKGETLSVAEWGRRIGVDRRSLMYRVKAGWPVEKIINGPDKKGPSFVPFDYKIIPTDVDKAYIAGYFDGEGCVTVAKRPVGSGVQIRVDFGQTQPQGVRYIHSFYGGSLIQRCGGEGRRPKIYYRLSQSQAVLVFLNDIFPYVKEKRDQVVLCLDLYRENMPLVEIQGLAEKLTRCKKRSL